MKEFFLIRIGIRINRKWEKAFSIEMSRYSNLSFSKTTHLKFLSRSELRTIYFQMSGRWNIKWFCLLHWNINRLNTRKCPINIFALSIFRLIKIRSYRRELFRRGLYWDVLVNIGLSLNVICCMFAHFFMQHIDGKYHIATALLVGI